MKRTIKLTLVIDNVQEDTPDGQDFARSIMDNFGTVDGKEEIAVAIETEYDE